MSVAKYSGMPPLGEGPYNIYRPNAPFINPQSFL
jgi:hypothetical protein